jgi:hypothetical protein
MGYLHLHLKLPKSNIKVPAVFLFEYIFYGLIGISQLGLGLIKSIKAAACDRIFFGYIDLFNDFLLI